MSSMRISAAIDQLKTVRGVTKHFLSGLTPDEWFWMPEPAVTHIAWQVGHIAFAEYGLCLKRLRGARPEDEQLISASFVERFGRGSTPVAGPENNPPVEDVLETMDRVHEQALSELAGYTDEELDVPVDPPHPVFKTNLGAVAFCPDHEALHAGQIVLLRRMLGKAPTW